MPLTLIGFIELSILRTGLSISLRGVPVQISICSGKKLEAIGILFWTYLGILDSISFCVATQKDIESSIPKYVQNKIPIASSFLPEQIDIWTGTPLNDIDNPVLRILNSINPIKVSGTTEPWRMWLLTTGWDGLGRLKKDSTGSYEYTEREREQIYKYIGEQQLYKKLIPLMKNKKYKKQVGLLRSHRATGGDLDNEMIKLKTQKLPLFREIDKIIKDAQIIAERRLLEERDDIRNTILQQRKVDQRMKQGDVQGASDIQKKELETRKLLQMAK